jgi:hypothetical protein
MFVSQKTPVKPARQEQEREERDSEQEPPFWHCENKKKKEVSQQQNNEKKKEKKERRQRKERKRYRIGQAQRGMGAIFPKIDRRAEAMIIRVVGRETVADTAVLTARRRREGRERRRE